MSQARTNRAVFSFKEFKQNSHNTFAKKMPEAVTALTFSHLSLRDIFSSVSRVCVGFYKDSQQDALLREVFKTTFRAEPLPGTIHSQIKAAFFYERARCEVRMSEQHKFYTSLCQVLDENTNADWTLFYRGILHLQDLTANVKPSLTISCKFFHDALVSGEHRAAQSLYQLEKNRQKMLSEAHKQMIPELKLDLVPSLKKLSKLGDSTALLQLADVYRNGIGVTVKDEKKAEEFMMRSLTEFKHHSAAIMLTEMYFKVDITEAEDEDFDKGIDFLTKTADELKSPSLFLQAGHHYMERAGYLIGYNQGLYAMDQEPENNSQTVRHYFREARRWFLHAFSLGSAEAAIEIGSLYEHGQGVAANELKAKRWFERSFKMGCGDSVMHLVNLIETEEIPHRTAEVMDWLKKGARLGSFDAMVRLNSSFTAEHEWEKDPVLVCWIIKIAMETKLPVVLSPIHKAPYVFVMLKEFYGEANVCKKNLFYGQYDPTEMQISMKDLTLYRETAREEGLLTGEFADILDQLMAKTLELKTSVTPKLR